MIPDRDFKAGDTLGAHTLNAIAAELRRLGKIAGVSPMSVSPDFAGITVGAAALDTLWWLRLGANAAGAYAWTRLVPVSGSGTWTNSPGGETGTTSNDPAREVNGNSALATNTVVMGWRDPMTNELRFVFRTCS